MLFTVLNWAGAASLAAAPFFIDTPQGKTAASIGLALLTLQAYRLRQWNLVALNLIGIVGYSHELFNL